MKLKDLINFGVNPDKVQVIDLPLHIDDRGLRLLIPQTFRLDIVDEINDSDGIYLYEHQDPPSQPNTDLTYQIMYCLK
jgi:hypothetical protein